MISHFNQEILLSNIIIANDALFLINLLILLYSHERRYEGTGPRVSFIDLPNLWAIPIFIEN